MPIPRAIAAPALGSLQVPLAGRRQGELILTDSGQLLYAYCCCAATNWRVACFTPDRLESALAPKNAFSGRDAIGGPSILYQRPRLPRGPGAAARSFSLIEPSTLATSHRTNFPCRQGCLQSQGTPPGRRLASASRTPYDGWLSTRCGTASLGLKSRINGRRQRKRPRASGWMTLNFFSGWMPVRSPQSM